MLRYAATAIAMLTALPAAAQTVTVRSGEHSDFTRLVIPRAATASWEVEQNGADVAISLGVRGLTLNTAQIFQRIPRTRLADVSATESSLKLRLNCECAIETSVYAGQYLVIDIKDGTPIARETLPQMAYRFPQFGGERLQDWPNRISVDRGNISEPVFASSPRTVVQASPRDSGLETVLYDPSVVQLLETEAFLDAEFHSDMQSASERNLVALAPEASALQGLVIPAGTSDLVIARNLADHISTSSSVIPELDGIFTQQQTCVSDHAFWPDEPDKLEGYAKEIGKLRRQAAREDASKDDKKKLAKTLLFFGFGAEAKQIAQHHFPDSSDSKTIAVIADVVDRGYSPDGGLLQHQLDCEGLIPIWAYLAHRDPNSVSSSTDFAAVAAAFSKLPAHLRSHLGPFAIERLAASGHPARAEQLQRLMDAATGGLDAPNLADATLKRELGDPDGADAVVETIATGNYPDAVAAMPQLVAQRVETLVPLSPEELDLLDSFATEYKGSAIEVELIHAQALAYGLDGRFDDAIELIEGQNLKSAGSLLRLLGQIGSDIDVLQHMVPNSELAQAFWLDERSLHTARRLLDLGFAQEVFTHLANPFTGDEEDRRRLLRAEAALDLDDPAAALRILRGAGGDAADLLRARAYEMSDGKADAQLLYARLGEATEANRVRFRNSGPSSTDPDPANDTLADNAVQDALAQDALAATTDETAGRYGAFNRSIAELSALTESETVTEITTAAATDLRQQSEETRALIESLLRDSVLSQ